MKYVRAFVGAPLLCVAMSMSMSMSIHATAGETAEVLYRGCEGSAQTSNVSATANGALFDIGMTKSVQQQNCSEDVSTRTVTSTMRTEWLTTLGACSALAAASNGVDSEVCAPTPTQTPIRQLTDAMVLEALRQVTLPEPAIVVQPPGGKTLVNFETIFHTAAEPFMRTVQLLGVSVDLDITPTSYSWAYGDGTTQTTSEPGVAYDEALPMTAYITHEYADADVTLRPQVATTYSARFRVDGGPWRDVSGTVTSQGGPVDLRVVEAHSVLLGTY